MKLLRLRLNNYCQHRELDVTFTGNLIGIVGENGSGKTNFVSSIGEAITGSFRKKKDKMITYGERKGSVILDWMTNDGLETVTVSRDLDGSGCSLSGKDHNGDPLSWSPKTASGPVNAAMAELFPYPATVLKGVIFTPQTDITSLLFDPKSSVRERMAMSFFGVEKAETIEATIAQVLSDIPIPKVPHGYRPSKELTEILIPEAEKATDEAELLLQDLEREVSDVDEQMKEFESQRAVPARNWIKFRETSTQESLIVGRVSGVRSEIEELKESVAAKRVEIHGVSLADLKERLGYSQKIESLTEKIKTLRRSADPLRQDLEEVKKESGKSVTKLVTEVEKLKIEIQTLSDDFRSAKDQDVARRALLTGDNAECLTCLRSGLTEEDTEKIQEEYDRGRKILSESGDEVSSLKAKLDGKVAKVDSITKEISKSEWKLENYESQIKEAQEELKVASDSAIETWGRITQSSKLEQVIEQVRNVTSGIKADEEALGVKQKSLLAMEAELKQTREFDIQDSEVEFASAAEAIKELEKLDRIKGKLSDKKSLVAPARAKVWNCQAELEDLRKELGRALGFEKDLSASEKSRRIVSGVRSIFHYSAAPKKIVSARVKKISARINDYLDALESNFYVDAKEGFDFDCVFGGRVMGKVMSPQDLSGGEQVALSVAFRLAAAETFCAGAGFLVLDEPTVWLDKKKVAHLPRVMERMANLARESGTQYLVVTHDTSLMESFDQIITIENE